MIGSDAVDDICGICNGDGTECEIIENVYNHTGQGKKHKYFHVHFSIFTLHEKQKLILSKLYRMVSTTYLRHISH